MPPCLLSSSITQHRRRDLGRPASVSIESNKMTSIWLHHVFLVSFLVWSLLGRSVVSAEDNFVVAGYLPDYRFYINLNATAPHMTDLILFSLEPSTSLSLKRSCCLGSDHYQKAREAQAYYVRRQQESTGRWISGIGGLLFIL